MGWKYAGKREVNRVPTWNGWKITLVCPCHGQNAEVFNDERSGLFTGTCPGGNPLSVPVEE